jgi:hypothetical protein
MVLLFLKKINFKIYNVLFGAPSNYFTEWRALRTITKPYLRGHPMKTIDLMGMSEIASPATIHKVIKNLIAKDLLSIKQDAPDGRIKFLIPTVLALKIFRGLAKKM